MIYLILGLFALYYLLILLLIAGWTKAAGADNADLGKTRYMAKVSVIVPFRNEASNLKSLVASLSAQTYPDYEVILVDDHSDDGSAGVLTELIRHQPNFKVIYSHGVGKKNALTTGIDAAHGEVIMTTDADCMHSSMWLDTMARPFADSHIKMVFGAVKIPGASAPMQGLEFVSVVATGIALFGLGQPVYCNGASMAFRKSVFLEMGGYQDNIHIPSGDDEFLLKKIAAAYATGICFVNAAESLVVTAPQPSIAFFIQQRIRWAGKWRSTTGAASRLLAVFMFTFQLACLGVMGMLFSGENIRLAGFLLMGKFLLDFVFLFNAGNFLKEKIRLIPFFAIQLLYPIYILGIGVAANFSGYSWKGRMLATKPDVPERV